MVSTLPQQRSIDFDHHHIPSQLSWTITNYDRCAIPTRVLPSRRLLIVSLRLLRVLSATALPHKDPGITDPLHKANMQ